MNPASQTEDLELEVQALKKQLAEAESRLRESGSPDLTASEGRGREKRFRGAFEDLMVDLAERKRAEALSRSEANYREFVEGTNDLVTQVDRDGNFLYLNRSAANLFGLTTESCVGRSAFDVVHPDDRARTQAAFKDWVRGRIYFVSFENRCVSAAGEVHHLLWTINLHYDAKGITQINSIARDVTEQKSAQEALRQSEQDLRLFIESAPVAIAMFDTEMRYLAASSRWLAFHGLSGNVIGMSHYDCSPEIPDHWRQVHRRTLAGGVERCEEERFVRSDGIGVWLMWEIRPWRKITGEIGGVVIFTEDITGRKEAEERLRESEEMLRYIVKHDPNAIAVYDRNLRYIAVSDRFLQDYNVKEADVIGRLHYDMFPEMPQRWKDVHQRCLAGAIEGSEDDYFERPDGSVTYNRWECRPWYQLNGQIGGIITYTEVTTQRKLAEAALRSAKEQVDRVNKELEQKVVERTAKLQETVEELEQFSYSITHDLRAPLRAIQGFARLLEEDCKGTLSQASQSYLHRMKASTERMDKLILDSLNYGKILIGQMPMETIDASALVRGIIQSYSIFQPPHAEVLVEGEFPPVLGNTAGLTQCVSNLLVNAVKFVAPGTQPCVRISAEIKADYVRLWFKDNGIGIPKGVQELIFGMFQQLNKSYEGTGIGLAIVRKAVERMGGKVGVESEPGQGSRFWLDLRRAK